MPMEQDRMAVLAVLWPLERSFRSFYPASDSLRSITSNFQRDGEGRLIKPKGISCTQAFDNPETLARDPCPCAVAHLLKSDKLVVVICNGVAITIATAYSPS